MGLAHVPNPLVKQFISIRQSLITYCSVHV